MVKVFKQFFWIFLMAWLGNLTATFLAPYVAIPGSVLGMLYLFIALQRGWLKLHQVKEVGDWLTGNMSLFFIPAGVGLMTVFHIIDTIWWQLILIIIVSVGILMVSVGKLVDWIIAHGGDHQ